MLVNVSVKEVTLRSATAIARVTLDSAPFDALIGKKLPKGNALESAKVAALLAAKQTPSLLPNCHPISLDSVRVGIEKQSLSRGGTISIKVTVKSWARTGVEMEAMTAAQIGALVIYDNVKKFGYASSKVEGVCLVSKSGGSNDL